MLSAEEIAALTGYSQPAKQVEELRRQGFWRARRNVLGVVVLERAHYEAVCRGQPVDGPRPQLRPPGHSLERAKARGARAETAARTAIPSEGRGAGAPAQSAAPASRDPSSAA
ncbi:DUF4224 domain-containing protein [Rubrivivax gelatinosus]|nr:DUF4224 domain-containing protein [Rubrivivax gelatinosus]